MDELAGKSGLAIVLRDEHSPALNKSNNNSMCEVLYNSEKFAPECEKFCGKAFRWATEAGETVGYKCYAGLSCRAVPMIEEEKQIVAIVGRAFTKADDFRDATRRAADGDWRQFPPSEFFENALLSNSEENLENLARKLEKEEKKRKREEENTNHGVQVSQSEDRATDNEREPTDNERLTTEETNPKSQIANRKSLWRSLFG